MNPVLLWDYTGLRGLAYWESEIDSVYRYWDRKRREFVESNILPKRDHTTPHRQHYVDLYNILLKEGFGDTVEYEKCAIKYGFARKKYYFARKMRKMLRRRARHHHV